MMRYQVGLENMETNKLHQSLKNAKCLANLAMSPLVVLGLPRLLSGKAMIKWHRMLGAYLLTIFALYTFPLISNQIALNTGGGAKLAVKLMLVVLVMQHIVYSYEDIIVFTRLKKILEIKFYKSLEPTLISRGKSRGLLAGQEIPESLIMSDGEYEYIGTTTTSDDIEYLGNGDIAIYPGLAYRKVCQRLTPGTDGNCIEMEKPTVHK